MEKNNENTLDKNIIDEEWYSLDDKQSSLGKLLLKLDEIVTKQDLLSKKVDQLVKTQTEHKEYEKQVISALHELKVIKEREVNVLLRDHIPFPFNHPSPSARKFRVPFSKK
jgi:hypothetical protein